MPEPRWAHEEECRVLVFHGFVGEVIQWATP
jgi:hypothetical protein